MVERLLILRNDTFDDDNEGNNVLTKNQSFNTEDDDDPMQNNSGQQSKSNSEASKNYINTPDDGLLKPSSFFTHSASVDTLNDQESLTGDVPTEKVKRKRRRTTQQTNSIDSDRRVSRVRPWYTKIDLIKPIIFIAIFILLYFMWVKRDVWIPRLLTSNTRIRYTTSINEQKLNERAEASQTQSKESSSGSQQDDDDNDDNNNNNINNDQTSSLNNDDDSPPTSNKQSTGQKLNIRTRRNKMSFSKDTPPKKRRYFKHRIVDDDDDDDDIDDDDDDDVILDDDDNTDDTTDETVVKESILPSSIHSSKKHRHHHPRSAATRKETSKHSSKSKTSITATGTDDIMDQLRRLIKSKGRHKDIVATLIKETGLDKSKINRFIHKKDFNVITLDSFISLLNSFDAKLLVIPN